MPSKGVIQMTASKKVKCIRIDAVTKSIHYVDYEVPSEDFSHQLPDFQKRVFARDESARIEEKISHLLYYKEGRISDPRDLPRSGFLFRHGGDLKNEFNPLIDHFTAVSGNALLVAYENPFNGREAPPIPCDVQLSLDEVRRMIPEYTNGVLWKLPDFTCILNESFSERGYELLLRIEIDALLYTQYMQEVTKPVRMLSPQIVNFAFQWNEITIITGKIESLEDKARVVIYEAGTSELKQVAACTLCSSKIPGWVQERLRDYFFEKMIALPFKKKYVRSTYKPIPGNISNKTTSSSENSIHDM